jgi:hypothetical protein
VAALPGARPLQQGGDARVVGGIEIGECVENPARTVEIARQQATFILREEWVQPGMDLAGEMSPDYLVGERQILTVGALRIGPSTSDSGGPSGLATSLLLQASSKTSSRPTNNDW